MHFALHNALSLAVFLEESTLAESGLQMNQGGLRRAARGWLAALALLGWGGVQAQTAPLHILVGFPAGGGTDAIARTLADRLKDQLGVPVFVDNRAGAGGQIAAQALKAAAPDGNTIFLSHDHTISILPLVVKNPGFDPAKDFVAVAGLATFVNAFAVSSGTPAKSVAEYVNWVKTQGAGKGTVGIPAPASIPEFLVQMIGQKYALDLQSAPYRGSAPMMADMLGNQIAAGVGTVPDFIENHRAGRVRMVAVLGPRARRLCPRCPLLPNWGWPGLTMCLTTVCLRQWVRRVPPWTGSARHWPRCWRSPTSRSA